MKTGNRQQVLGNRKKIRVVVLVYSMMPFALSVFVEAQPLSKSPRIGFIMADAYGPDPPVLARADKVIK